MKFTEHKMDGVALITGYGPGYVRVGEKDYRASLLLSPDALDPAWPCGSMEELTPEAMSGILAGRPELVLIGCGARQAFPPRSVLRVLAEAGVGAEFMSTEAACRTYNLLVLEGRKVQAALIVV